MVHWEIWVCIFFDTPYAALDLDVPRTVKNECRAPNGYGHPEKNMVTYKFPGTAYTTNTLKWVWYDGVDAPKSHKDLQMPNGGMIFPNQGAMFIGQKGRLLLPHIDYPVLIVNGQYEEIEFPELDPHDHYHQFVDACMGKDEVSAPFSYAARLSEAILLGVVANRFPGKTLKWDNALQRFKLDGPNELLSH